jgi:uncharacterized protein (TIGR00251 family)
VTAGAGAWRPVADGLLLAVRLQPAAGRDALDGLIARDDGSLALKARVTAAPEAGKANAALLALLAKRLDLAKRDLEIVAGSRARSKTVKLSGEPGALAERLTARLAAAGKRS